MLGGNRFSTKSSGGVSGGASTLTSETIQFTPGTSALTIQPNAAGLTNTEKVIQFLGFDNSLKFDVTGGGDMTCLRGLFLGMTTTVPLRHIPAKTSLKSKNGTDYN